MIQNHVSQELSQTVIDQVIAHLDAIRALLPFLIGLSPQQRRHMLNAGDASQGFIRKSTAVAPIIADYLPRGLNLAEMTKDVQLMDALQPIRVRVDSLAEQLSDTQALATSEAYAAALLIYRSAKEARGVTGIDDAVRELSQRFARSSNSADAAPAPEPEPTLAS